MAELALLPWAEDILHPGGPVTNRDSWTLPVAHVLGSPIAGPFTGMQFEAARSSAFLDFSTRFTHEMRVIWCIEMHVRLTPTKLPALDGLGLDPAALRRHFGDVTGEILEKLAAAPDEARGALRAQQRGSWPEPSLAASQRFEWLELRARWQLGDEALELRFQERRSRRR